MRDQAVIELVKAYQNHSRVQTALAHYRSGRRVSTSTDMVTVFMAEAGAYPLLTAEDEQEYFARLEKALQAVEDASNVDQADPTVLIEGVIAYEIAMRSNLRLVMNEAKKYQNFNIPLIDLFQEGTIGLATAVRRFDFTKGWKFSTFGTHWVRQQITKYIGDASRTIRLPVHAHEQWVQTRVIYNKLMVELGRPPAPEEIAIKFNNETEESSLKRKPMTAQRVRFLNKHGQIWLPSLNTPANPDIEGDLLDVIDESRGRADRAIEDFENLDEIERLLENLNVKLREKYVLSLRFGVYLPSLSGSTIKVKKDRILDYDEVWKGIKTTKGLNLEEVGDLFGITRERIRQIERDGLEGKKLRGRPPN